MSESPTSPEIAWRRGAPVLVVFVLILAAFSIAAFAAPVALDAAFERAFRFSTQSFGWLYLSATSAFVGLLAYLAFSRTGSILLGQEGEPPEYSLRSWLAMIFATGMGVGLVFWGVAEPIAHFVEPPRRMVDPQSAIAARDAMRYSVFHWGVHQWALYTVVALSIAYARFRAGQPGLISACFRPLLGAKTSGPLGWTIDIVAVIATVFGVATTLGFGILQASGGFHETLGTPLGVRTELLITLIVTACFTASASTKLSQGILFLSHINMVVACVLALFVFVFGPTVAILDTAVQTMGDVLARFVEMSLSTRPFSESDWVERWTIFYWAWALSWSPFVGMFIARISRGRTVREFILGVMLIPAAISAIWFFIFGGSALHYELFGEAQIVDAAAENTSLALFALLEQLPLPTLSSLTATLLVMIFLVTSADSATFVLSMFTSGGEENPPNSMRILWGLAQAALASALLYTSGLHALRTVSITTALPFLMLLLVMVGVLVRSLKRDLKQNTRASRIST